MLALDALRQLDAERARREELEPLPGPPIPSGYVRRNGDGTGRGKQPPEFGRALSQRR